MTWIANGTVLTLGDSPRLIADGAVRVEGDAVAWVGPRAEAGAIEGEVIDAGGAWIMPGFINAHMHFYSTFACGMALKDDPPANFVQILERLWWRLDKALSLEDVKYSALVPLARGLRAGVTTVIDHHSSPCAIRGSLTAIADAARQVGVRTCLCYEVSNRDGERSAKEGIEENVAFLESCRGGDGMTAGVFGLHASMTLDDELLAECVKAGDALGSGFHIHVSESRFDSDDSLARYEMRVVRRLSDAGVLGPKSIAAHCVHVGEEEIRMLAESNTGVVHNPQSNMNNAVGRAEVPRLLEGGICVGVGTDGMSASVLDDFRLVTLLQRHGLADPCAGFVEAGRLLLEGNRRIASRYFDKPVGELSAGAKADVIVVEYHPPTPVSLENLVGHMLFGVPSARVSVAMVDGIVRMRDGVVLGVDEKEIAAKARDLARGVWERF